MSQIITTTSQKIVNGIVVREMENIISLNPSEEAIWEVTVPNGQGEGFSLSDVGTPKLLLFNSSHEVTLTIANTAGGNFLNVPTKNLKIEGTGWSNVAFTNNSGYEVTASLQVYGNLA